MLLHRTRRRFSKKKQKNYRGGFCLLGNPLEPRLCLDGSYELSVIASSGGAIDSITQFPSINDRGEVALIASLSGGGEGIYVGNGTKPAANIAQSVPPDHTFLASVQLNNAGKAIVTERDLSPLRSFLRVYDKNQLGPANFETLTYTVGFTSLSSIFTFPSLNNTGTAAFAADNEYYVISNPPPVNQTPTFVAGTKMGTTTGSMRPLIADNGAFVAFDGNAIGYFPGSRVVASPQQFSKIGAAPGISDDGRMVVFYAEDAQGPGIFAVVEPQSGSAPRRITPIRGNGILEPGETWVDANSNQVIEPGEDIGGFLSFPTGAIDPRVGVNHADGPDSKNYAIAYLAEAFDPESHTNKVGLYVSHFDPSPKATIPISAPVRVIQAGDIIPSLPGKVQEISLHDPINNLGQVAFWVSTDESAEAVVRASNAAALLFRERCEICPSSWGIPNSEGKDGIPGFDHVAIALDGKVYESNVPYAAGQYFDIRTGEHVSIEPQDGVQAQHTIGSFQHDSIHQSSDQVLRFEQIFIPRSLARDIVDKIKTKLVAPGEQPIARFANFDQRTQASKLASLDPLVQKGQGAGGTFTCIGLIEWAAEQIPEFNNGQGFIPNVLEKNGNMPVLSPESLFYRLTGAFSDPAGIKRVLQGFIDPVDFILTDPQGRRLGHTAEFGTINEIPGATYTGKGLFEQFFIPGALLGEYHIQYVGLGEVAFAGLGTTANAQILDEFLDVGERRELIFEVVNQEPFAFDDAAETVEFAAVAIPVIDNDNDPDGAFGANSVTIANNPQYGAVAVDAETGVVTYTPDHFFVGTDTFTYTVTDADGAVSNEATVTIEVTSAPRFPFELVSRAEPTLISETGNRRSESRPNSMSRDGRFVAFVSSATNLAPGHVDGLESIPSNNVFLRDTVNKTTILVSHVANDEQVPADGDNPVVSGDGRYVVYTSFANNLVAGQKDENVFTQSRDVFLFDRVTGETKLVSHVDGDPLNPAEGSSPTISADGNWVVFLDKNSKLVLYDRSSDSLTRFTFSANSDGAPVISADGRFVAFATSDNIVPGMTNRAEFGQNVFVYDRVEDKSELVSHLPTDALVSGDRLSRQPHISDDGRYIVYQSQASDLVVGQQEARSESYDVFVFDRITGENQLVTHAPGSPTMAVGAFATKPLISADGSVIVYDSVATNLVAGQSGDLFFARPDVFAYVRSTGENILVSRRDGTATQAVDRHSVLPVVSGDGKYIAYFSRSSQLVTGQVSSFTDSTDLFLFDRTTEMTTLVSHVGGSPLVEGNGHSLTSFSLDNPSTYQRLSPVISHDGAWVAYTSFASDLLANAADGNSAEDVFLYDRATGENAAVSAVAPDGASLTASRFAAGVSADPFEHASTSADGRFIAFLSSSPNLIAGQAGAGGVFLYDRHTLQMMAVSHAFDSNSRVEQGEAPVISADGKYVVYQSRSSRLVQGQPTKPANDFSTDIFLFERETGLNRLVSHAFGSATQTVGGDSPVISGDGRYIAYHTNSANLVQGQTNSGGVALYDRVTDVTVLVSHKHNSLTDGVPGDKPSISANGQFVTYESFSRDLVAGFSGGTLKNIYVFDRTTGANTLVSHAHDSTVASSDNGAGTASISANGASIIYRANSRNLVPGFQGPELVDNIYIYDMATGENRLVNHEHDAPSTAPPLVIVSGMQRSDSIVARISGDGRHVVYESAREASDLVDGVFVDGGLLGNVFRYNVATHSSTLVSSLRVPEVSPLPIPSAGTGATISHDGRFITYTAPYLEERGYRSLGAPRDVLLFDAMTGDTRLISGLNANTAGNNGSPSGGTINPQTSLLSTDGTTVVFLTDSTVLVPQDHNRDLDMLVANVAAPEAIIQSVFPNPRNKAISQATISFVNKLADGASLSTPVEGFDLADLSLARNGGPNLLTSAQTLTPSNDGQSWILGNLAELTGIPGDYVLTVLADDSGIQNVFSGRQLVNNAAVVWTFTEAVPTWHNVASPTDTNNDGQVNLSDLLAVVTFLRDNGIAFALPAPTIAFGPPPLVDVDNDGQATLADLLAVVVELRNRLSQPLSGEAETDLASAGAMRPYRDLDYIFAEDEDWCFPTVDRP